MPEGPSEKPSGGASGGGGGTSASATGGGRAKADELSQLRTLLLGPERKEIAQVKQQLERLSRVGPDDVAPVLPQAVIQSSRDGGQQMTEAMLPVVEDDIGLSVKRHPDKLADLLFPVMGPAIRKAIREALNSMIESINQTVDHAVSPRAIQWRFEALRSGKTFAEVVFLHTMMYRVEQVFLIHRKTGLLLQHVAAPNARVIDPDMVSGMLTAIRDFVRDSFKGAQLSSEEGDDDLETLEVGEMTVWIVPGPSACMAGAIRGHAPRDLRSVFHAALEDIHREQSSDLQAFKGETAEFELAKPHLEGCLQFQSSPTETAAAASRHWYQQPAYLLGIVLGLALLTAGVLYWNATSRWNRYLSALRGQPGLVLTKAEMGLWSNSKIEGLRDPMAADPQALLTASGLDRSDVDSTWTPYQALEPSFMLARAKNLLVPPPTVAMTLQPGGVLEASGLASAAWMADARKLALAVPGVTRFDGGKLVDVRWAELQQVRDKVQVYNVLFAEGRSRPLPTQEQTVQQLGSDIARVVALAREVNRPVSIEIFGHTDGSGAESVNRMLSVRRAETIRALLAARLPRDVSLAVKGVSNGNPLREERSDEDRAWNRRVAVKVTIGEGRPGAEPR